ncbi:hypothetical protein BACCAP_04847 [Pseudoflavonifractor capillosus ATCC 29799]|uniref:Uncharacterized protein n=1 Tax=Pseudoflavonifractor capillosus ATCC 29799 TaxID=411467 RepID=A6P2W3_9FIRM|nr:hypothetical protein BACCAP_04847 [Pseudoflavonifractor capillosus ATCC 29799]
MKRDAELCMGTGCTTALLTFWLPGATIQTELNRNLCGFRCLHHDMLARKVNKGTG